MFYVCDRVTGVSNTSFVYFKISSTEDFSCSQHNEMTNIEGDSIMI
jgi:hypothetical protein